MHTHTSIYRPPSKPRSGPPSPILKPGPVPRGPKPGTPLKPQGTSRSSSFGRAGAHRPTEMHEEQQEEGQEDEEEGENRALRDRSATTATSATTTATRTMQTAAAKPSRPASPQGSDSDSALVVPTRASSSGGEGKATGLDIATTQAPVLSLVTSPVGNPSSQLASPPPQGFPKVETSARPRWTLAGHQY